MLALDCFLVRTKKFGLNEKRYARENVTGQSNRTVTRDDHRIDKTISGPIKKCFEFISFLFFCSIFRVIIVLELLSLLSYYRYYCESYNISPLIITIIVSVIFHVITTKITVILTFLIIILVIIIVSSVAGIIVIIKSLR